MSAIWSGPLKYAKLQFAVRILSGPTAETPSFKQLCPCGSPINQNIVCAAEGKTLKRDTLGRGFEVSKVLTITDAELATVQPRRSEQLTLDSMCQLPDVDPLHFENTYFLHPDSDEDEPGYAALFLALRGENAAGLGTIVLRSRERPILVRAGTVGLIAHTLYFQNETRALQEFRTQTEEIAPATLRSARAAVRDMDFAFPALVDPFPPKLQALIDEKLAAAPRKNAQSEATSARGKKRAAKR